MKTRKVVLVVEDEDLLRLTAIETIENEGFDAVEAANADEAISILESRPDIHLIFTDIHMPGSMDGLKLSHYVRDRWPPIRIVTTSGRARLTRDQMPSQARFLPKPYTAWQLGAVLQEMSSSV